MSVNFSRISWRATVGEFFLGNENENLPGSSGRSRYVLLTNSSRKNQEKKPGLITNSCERGEELPGTVGKVYVNRHHNASGLDKL